MTAEWRDVAVIGGGCYGTFYAGQLAEAKDRGKAAYRRVLVVDHDPGCRAGRELPIRDDRELVLAEWDDFLDRFLAAPGEADALADRMDATWRVPTAPDDAIVPSPMMPHLMAGWLERRAQAWWPGRAVERRPLPGEVGTPYESTGPDGTRYLSFADWLCPVHCIEPLTCPVTRAPRTWEQVDTLAAFARSAGLAGPATFLCRHQAFGVGMFFAREAHANAGVLREAGASGHDVSVVVGTVSRCHGAVTLLHLGILEPTGALE